MPALEGKRMFIYIAPKKSGVVKKSQQKLDRERREAEAKAQQKLQQSNAETSDDNGIPTSGVLFANAKNGADALKKLNESNEQ